MAGMEGLGRVFNVIPVADTKPFNLDQCSAVSLIAVTSTTAAATLVVTASKTFGGSYVAFTPGNGFGQAPRWYQSTASDGTAAWTKQAATWVSNALTIAGTSGYVSVVDIFGSQMADGFKYLSVDSTNSTVIVVTHDLTVGRTPANLKIMGA
jgi:hypothetical protein